MSQGDVSQTVFEKDLDGSGIAEYPTLFGGYSGLALRVSRNFDILEENTRAGPLAVLLRDQDNSELKVLINATINKGTITEGVVSLPKAKGGHVLEITILPENGSQNLIILAHDRRSEEILAKIVSSVRDELDPQKMLSVAAIATAQALGVEGCRIYRCAQQDKVLIAAESGKPQELEALNEEFQVKIEDGETRSLEVGSVRVLSVATRYRNKVNGAMVIWTSLSGDKWENGFMTVLSKIADHIGVVNEQLTNHERMLLLSRTDSLTGLLNRRAFMEEELPRRIARLQRSEQSAALFYADLDNFKLVNDVHGHRTGDKAILKLRNLLMDLSRPGDVVARLGGDEFAMWLDGVTAKVAEDRAQRLIKKSIFLMELSGAEDRPLGVSVGVAMFDPSSGENLDDLIARADAAMYAIKKTGKGGFQMAPERNK